MSKRLVVNKARCLRCDDIIESNRVHEFNSCDCGAIAVDGGLEYVKRMGFAELIEDMCEWDNGEDDDTIEDDEPTDEEDASMLPLVDCCWQWKHETVKTMEELESFVEKHSGTLFFYGEFKKAKFTELSKSSFDDAYQYVTECIDNITKIIRQ